MKKFSFDLERMLRLAQISEEAHRGALIKADSEYRACQQETHVRQSEIQNLNYELSQSPQEFSANAARESLLIDGVRFAKNSEVEAQKIANEKKADWSTKKSAYESLLRLRERRYQEFAENASLVEQKSIDEQGSIMWLRRNEGGTR